MEVFPQVWAIESKDNLDDRNSPDEYLEIVSKTWLCLIWPKNWFGKQLIGFPGSGAQAAFSIFCFCYNVEIFHLDAMQNLVDFKLWHQQMHWRGLSSWQLRVVGNENSKFKGILEGV